MMTFNAACLLVNVPKHNVPSLASESSKKDQISIDEELPAREPEIHFEKDRSEYTFGCCSQVLVLPWEDREVIESQAEAHKKKVQYLPQMAWNACS